MTFQLYAEGFLHAVSVGFRPLDWRWAAGEERADGIDFQRQELLEFSCVPVPANPEALVAVRAKGIDLTPLLQRRKGASEQRVEQARTAVPAPPDPTRSEPMMSHPATSHPTTAHPTTAHPTTAPPRGERVSAKGFETLLRDRLTKRLHHITGRLA